MTASKINQQSTPRIWVIVPAAGSGQRMGASTAKQYLQINNKTILETTLELFLSNEQVNKIVVTYALDDALWPALPCAKNTKIMSVLGGNTRALSVYNALVALKSLVSENDWLIVHDAARPCLSPQALSDFIEELHKDSVGGILAMPAKDTLKLSNTGSPAKSLKTLDRGNVWHAQTPQMFRYGLLLNAMEQALNSEYEITDEASAMELVGYSPRLIEGSSSNIKVTTPEDLAIATFLLSN